MLARYGLGAQGIDLISAQRVQGPAGDPLMAVQSVDPLYPNSTQRVSFPVYDGHGNMICTVARNGNGYSVQNVKRYDVWGGVRSDSGASSSSSGGHLANTDKRYCANLGHATDIETGLIYMRARYYEPTTGRFLSEDPARDGANWFAYCANNPVGAVDPTGKFILVHFAVTNAFWNAGVRLHKEGDTIALASIHFEGKVIHIGLDFVQKRVAQVGYNQLVKELSAVAASNGAAAINLRAIIVSPGGQRFMEQLRDHANLNGWPAELTKNNGFTHLYWLFEAFTP